MSLVVAPLNSGSNGNCYYIGNDIDAVLIDAGLSCRETEKRMKRIGLSMDKVRAVFISHEHGDHIKGVEAISSKHKLPVYITQATLHHGRLRIPQQYVIPFKAYSPVLVGTLEVHAFPKFHDAADPHSFIIKGNDMTIGVFTDIGIPCDHVINHFKECHAAFLEANYDDTMLSNGRYPEHLKRRIRSDVGHLSNHQALELFLAHRPPFMTHLFLSHLSRDNNDPQLATELFTACQGDVEIVVASRYKETGIFYLGLDQKNKTGKPMQMSLF